jgi:uncharacterized protein (TIGR03382 family)
MTGVVIGLVVLLVVVWWLRRRRRQTVLAGRDATRPTYMVEPPARTVGKRRTELL